MDIDIEIQAAIERVHALVDNRHARARAELRAMCEASRRSIGQRFRYVMPEALSSYRAVALHCRAVSDRVLRAAMEEQNLQDYLRESAEEAHGRDGHPDGSR